uniref:Protein tyrosine phosphatase non-receptor type 12 n=1 Tax=Rousettus aegyptiacus TaxID=9407 RepID=A0A7J8D8I5_ROUAE|nr:protein tyrosine phosphatase non-receptor type 12 [Rousettus aegyptiacus]
MIIQEEVVTQRLVQNVHLLSVTRKIRFHKVQQKPQILVLVIAVENPKDQEIHLQNGHDSGS